MNIGSLIAKAAMVGTFTVVSFAAFPTSNAVAGARISGSNSPPPLASKNTIVRPAGAVRGCGNGSGYCATTSANGGVVVTSKAPTRFR
jgi:hypothetical protein